MDSSQYTEDLAGPSPWASSPKASRNSLDNPPDAAAASRTSLDGSQASQSDTLPPAALAASQSLQQATSDPATEEASTNGSHPALHDQPDQHHQDPSQHSSQSESRAQPQRYHRPQNSQSAPQQPRQQQYKLQPKVTGLERPSRKDLVIRFDIYTNLPGFRTTQFRDVRRTHTEFQRLADHLISANPEVMVPALPPSSTPAGIGTEEDDARVKASMQRWLAIVCSSDMLMRDEELVRFVEGDPGYSPVFKRTQPATGVRRKYIKQFAPPPDNTPELAEARPTVKKFYLATMDASQKLDRTVKARRSLGTSLATFGQTLQAISDLEPHAPLKNGERKLGRTIQTTGDLHAAQATMESTVLSSALSYSSSDAFIVKETLTNRQILMRDLQAAAATTRAKISATDRLRSSTSVRRDKVDEAITALDEAKEHEGYLTQKTARVTACLLHEHRAWTARTTADLRAAIKEFTLRQIEAERRQLATLEAVRPDVRAIDPAGGLSRLGRDGARLRVVPSSQGPKGDAWSGVQRRPDGGIRGLSSVSAGPYAPGEAKADGEDAAQDDSAKKRPGSSRGEDAVVDEDEDRVDARNAASRLATSTF